MQADPSNMQLVSIQGSLNEMIDVTTQLVLYYLLSLSLFFLCDVFSFSVNKVGKYTRSEEDIF